jgi:ABC-2 type transport system ATP-binding protein
MSAGPSHPKILTVTEASKRYGDVVAVDRVSLGVGTGEIYAILGVNGAGKTTLIRMLLGLVRPSSGRVTLFGTNVRPGETSPWARVGYLVETATAYPDLTVEENLRLLARLRRVGHDAVPTVIDQLGLGEYRRRPARHLSLGNKQRLGLAKAILHRPLLLILDEPANGLDPAGVVEIRELLRDLAGHDGTTVLLSSHVLTEVSRLASRIGILHKGQLVREIDANGLDTNVRQWVTVSARDDDAAFRVLRDAGLRPERAHDGLTLTERTAVDKPDDIAVLLTNAGHPPVQLLVQREDLEAFFLRVVGADKEARDA